MAHENLQTTSRASFRNPVFVTSNRNKLREAEEILGVELDSAAPEVPELQSLDFSTVALAKVRAAREALGDPPVPVFVDDSGLAVGAWNGFPGALTKWLLASVGPEGLLGMLEGFPDRSARAVCVVAVSEAGGETHVFEGVVPGRITPEKRGHGGFGYDPVFLPEGSDLTYSQLGPDKQKLSHRAAAFEKLADWLRMPARNDPQTEVYRRFL